MIETKVADSKFTPKWRGESLAFQINNAVLEPSDSLRNKNNLDINKEKAKSAEAKTKVWMERPYS